MISSATFCASSGLCALILTAPSASNTFAFPAGSFAVSRYLANASSASVGFHAAGIVDLTKRAQVFFRGLEILLVVIFNPEPLQDFRRHICVRTICHKVV